MLALAVAVPLCNHLTLPVIAEWGAAQPAALQHALGFTRGYMPHVSKFQRLFRHLDPTALATTLTAYFHPALPGDLCARDSQGVAIDGKAYTAPRSRQTTVKTVDYRSEVER